MIRIGLEIQCLPYAGVFSAIWHYLWVFRVPTRFKGHSAKAAEKKQGLLDPKLWECFDMIGLFDNFIRKIMEEKFLLLYNWLILKLSCIEWNNWSQSAQYSGPPTINYSVKNIQPASTHCQNTSGPIWAQGSVKIPLIADELILGTPWVAGSVAILIFSLNQPLGRFSL